MSMQSQTSFRTSRPLEGLVVGISVSADEDTPALGVTEDTMNQIVIRLSDRLLEAGARLAFGHDWRPHGVMAAVSQLAARYEPEDGEKGDNVPCRITNFVAWDDQPELGADLRSDLESRGMLRIVEIPRPILQPRHACWGSKETLRALALSQMRAKLAELCHARICLGGKTKKFSGQWPGILEEAWLSAKRNCPLFLTGIFGGASLLLIDAAQSQSWDTLPWGKLDLDPSNPPSMHYIDFVRSLRRLAREGYIDLPDEERMNQVWSWELLQQRSGLNPELWRRLVEARDIEIIASLVIVGLTESRKHGLCCW